MLDSELLRHYEASGSEAAFEALVRRHMDMVYAAARRQVGDDATAQEVAQKVFCLLAARAGRLAGRQTVAGWLYRATCFLAAKEIRGEARRRRREREAITMNESATSEGPEWERVSPVLDELLQGLPERERLPMILRFFQRKSMAEVGAALGISEAAVKMRIGRRVERLRQGFARKGIAGGAAALAVALTEKAAPASPTEAVAKAVAAMKTAAGNGAALTVVERALLWGAPAKQLSAATAAVGVVALAGLVAWSGWGGHADFRIGSERHYTTAGVGSPFSNSVAKDGGKARVKSARDFSRLIARLKKALHAPHEANPSGYPSADVREVLEDFGQNAAAAFPTLKEALGDPDHEVRLRAASGFGVIVRHDPEVAPFLWEVLNKPESYDGSPHLSVASLAFVSLWGSRLAPTDLPSLADLLEEPKDLMTIGRYAPEAVASILTNNPAESAPYLPVLEGLLDQTNFGVRFRAACALAPFEAQNNPRIVEILGQGLRKAPEGTLLSPDLKRREQEMAEFREHAVENLMALETLEQIGPVAKPAVPQIRAYAAAAKGEPFMSHLALKLIGELDAAARTNSTEVDAAMRIEEQRNLWQGKFASNTMTLG